MDRVSFAALVLKWPGMCASTACISISKESLSNRVVEGSTIRIGVSEIGYAFPAPTGIVDYDLRHAGNGTPSATIVASAGPFEAHGLSIDGNLPLISASCNCPWG